VTGSVRVLTTLAELEAAGPDWDGLHSRAGRGPFLAHSWLTSYWRAFGDRSGLRVVCVRSGDRLTAAAAVRRSRRHGVPVLTPLAAELSDFTDVLIDPDVPPAAGDLAGALLAVGGWSVLDAAEVPPGGGAWRLAAAWPGQTVVLPASTCLELPVRPLPELLAELPSRHRRDLARQQRRAARLALRAERVPPAPEPIAAAVGDLLDLHARQWAGRPVNPLHLDPRFRAHLTEAARAMVPAGQAALTRFVLAGELVGVAFALIADGAVGGYLYGVRPELRDQLDISSLVIRSDLELGRHVGATRLSMLRGQEDPKLRWQPTPRRSQRMLLLPPAGAGGHGLAVAALLRRAAAERVRQADLGSGVGVKARVIEQARRRRVVPGRQHLADVDDVRGVAGR
jgi:CelD/BcsL family acetyltransferase involved in cellulose biosynthesis